MGTYNDIFLRFFNLQLTNPFNFKFSVIVENKQALDLFNNRLDLVIETCLKYDYLTPEENKEIANTLKKHYFTFDKIDERSFDILNEVSVFKLDFCKFIIFCFYLQFVADGSIAYGVHRFVHLAGNYTKLYYHEFVYKGRFSYFYYPQNDVPYGK